MNPRKRLRELISGALKDKASLIKASLTTKRAVSSVRVAVIRATTHASASPPPDHRVAAILDLGDRSVPVICAITDRLHRTRDPFVALKCLYVLHSLIVKGSLPFKDHLSFYPAAGGHNSLNLSGFAASSGGESRELSPWVRWYAGVLEQSIMTFKILGNSSVSFPSINFDKITAIAKDSKLRRQHAVKETESLVCMVEDICRAPESLHWRKNDVVHEVMVLVSDDYRAAQFQIMLRLSELRERVGKLSYAELTELQSCLRRLEGCKERMIELFIRRRNDAFWETVRRTRAEIDEVKEEWERQSLVLWNAGEEKSTESTRPGGRVGGATKQMLLLPYNNSRW
ncbi:PREDICTED: putative clathrin assembly protein At4g40080 [Ipomoea nil]|uniref:putative clathrin assembly protein At4g40080 n=1 Tax=Ipomoea nil TaxID=35883 RepID=UPI000901834C|nr:PREDICTED: putative clathrin assembly protein At4g40080 [Ipomoea nil]